MEFAEWQQLYGIEPWGDDWQQAGTVAATQVNLWSKRKYKPEAFIPRAKQQKTAAQMESEMMQWARLYNSRLEKVTHG